MATRPRKTPALKSPSPLTLKGSKLEEFLPLLPAEEKLRQCAANGEVCEVDDFDGKRPEAATSLNTVRAEFLRYMILGGCDKSPVASVGINLFGAHISSGSLNLNSSTIIFSLILENCNFQEAIFLVGANTRTISLGGSIVAGIKADTLSCLGSIILDNNFQSIGMVIFKSAEIKNHLQCTNGKFSYSERSIVCDGLKVHGAIFFDEGFQCEGEIRLLGVKIDHHLICRNGTLASNLIADNLSVGENVFFDGSFKIEGVVSLRNARIGEALTCKNANFSNADNSLIASQAKIGGDVHLENAIAKGTIALTGTEIGGDFTPQGASLEGTPALQLRNSKIGGTLVWRSLKHVNGEVDFSGASCATINTDGDTWMRKREAYHEKRTKVENAQVEAEAKKVEYTTKLDNFTYGGFSNLPDNCKPAFWVEFLNQQPQDHLEKNFKPRPWEQLASVLDTMGYQEEALELRIEKQKLQTSFMASHEPVAKSGLNLWHWGQVFFRRFIWGPLVGYGYKPGNALVYLFALIMLGTIIYDQAAKRGIMTPTHPLIFKEAREGGSIPAWCAENWVYFPDENCGAAMPSEYSEFQSFIYAADVALPVVNLRMEVDWAPRVVFTDGTPDQFGWWVRFYEWILIASGWILSLLFVSAVGSSIRK